MIYLDTCIVIYLVEGEADVAEPIRQRLAAAGNSCAASHLTRLECRVLPLREHNEALLARYEAFFTAPELVMLGLAAEVFELAAGIRAAHRTATPDALHLATAIHAGCEEFWTNDLRLAPAAEGRISLVTP